jgi:hypothetical protein
MGLRVHAAAAVLLLNYVARAELAPGRPGTTGFCFS